MYLLRASIVRFTIFFISTYRTSVNIVLKDSELTYFNLRCYSLIAATVAYTNKLVLKILYKVEVYTHTFHPNNKKLAGRRLEGVIPIIKLLYFVLPTTRKRLNSPAKDYMEQWASTNVSPRAGLCFNIYVRVLTKVML